MLPSTTCLHRWQADAVLETIRRGTRRAKAMAHAHLFATDRGQVHPGLTASLHLTEVETQRS